jgi:hypothetical protein
MSKFYKVGFSTPQPTPNLEDQTLLVWVITFDLSSMEAPASSYAIAGIALRII